MKKVKLKFHPKDRGNIANVIKSMEEGIININMTEGVFIFMRGTAIVEMCEKDFDTNLPRLKSRLKSVCSRYVKVTLF